MYVIDTNALVRVVRKLATFLVLSLAVYPSLGAAETVEFNSVELPVDELTILSAQQAKVRIGGASFLVPEKDVGRKVASIYLTTPGLIAKLKPELFRALIIKGLEVGEKDLVISGLGTWIPLRPSPLAVRELASALSPLPGGSEVLQRVIESLPEGVPVDGTCPILTALPPKNRQVLREKSQQVIYRLQFTCAVQLESEARRLLEEGKATQALQNLSALSEVFVDVSSGLEPLIAAKNRLQKLVDAVAASDYTAVVRTSKSLEDDPWLKPYAVKVRREVVSSTAKQAIAEKAPAEALKLLSIIEFTQRSARDHEVVSSALTDLDVNGFSLLTQSTISGMLRSYAFKDEKIKGVYITTLERAMTHALALGDIPQMNMLMEQLLTIRPDPSERNDAMRVAMTRRLMDLGEVTASRMRLEEIRTGVPLGLRLEMFFKMGVIGNLILVGAALLFSICLIILIAQRRSRTVNVPNWNQEPLEPESESESESTEPRRFVVYSHGVKVGHRPDEYAECLQTFGLKRGATLQQIKVAYRNAVKTCHPDLNPNAGPEESAKFIRLTKTYDRLVVLHTYITGER